MSPQYTLTLPDEKYFEFKKALVESSWFFEEDRTLFALALGSNRSSVFDAIAKNSEIEIVWRGSYLPWWARPFGIISAAYGGFVKVRGRAGLEIVCENLLPRAAMEFLVVSKRKEEAVGRRLQSLGRKASALKLAEEEAEGVLAAMFVYDDSSDDYPIIYRRHLSTDFPFLHKYENPA